jgi:multicomponent Na+:H+ antiporter subunit F
VTLAAAALVVLAACLAAALARLVRGPTDADRVVAAEFAFLVIVAGTAVLAVRLGVSALLDVVIVATLVGFVASVALARHGRRGPAVTPLAVLGGAVLAAGVALVASAALGLLRLPDAYCRANAVTKAGGLGIVLVLLGVLALRPGMGERREGGGGRCSSCRTGQRPGHRAGGTPQRRGARAGHPARRPGRGSPAPRPAPDPRRPPGGDVHTRLSGRDAVPPGVRTSPRAAEPERPRPP